MKEEETTFSAFDCLVVTQVQVFPFKPDASIGHVRALVNVVLNDQLIIRGLRVLDGENGLFVVYPFDPFYKGEEMRSLVKPLYHGLQEHIENCVLEKFQQAIRG